MFTKKKSARVQTPDQARLDAVRIENAKKVYKLFDAIDTDGNGQIDKFEMMDFCRTHGVNLAKLNRTLGFSSSTKLKKSTFVNACLKRDIETLDLGSFGAGDSDDDLDLDDLLAESSTDGPDDGDDPHEYVPSMEERRRLAMSAMKASSTSSATHAEERVQANRRAQPERNESGGLIIKGGAPRPTADARAELMRMAMAGSPTRQRRDTNTAITTTTAAWEDQHPSRMDSGPGQAWDNRGRETVVFPSTQCAYASERGTCTASALRVTGALYCLRHSCPTCGGQKKSTFEYCNGTACNNGGMPTQDGPLLTGDAAGNLRGLTLMMDDDRYEAERKRKMKERLALHMKKGQNGQTEQADVPRDGPDSGSISLLTVLKLKRMAAKVKRRVQRNRRKPMKKNQSLLRTKVVDSKGRPIIVLYTTAGSGARLQIGLTLMKNPAEGDNDGIIVKSITPGGLAERCGKFTAGAAIISINGIDTTSLGMHDIQRIFREQNKVAFVLDNYEHVVKREVVAVDHFQYTLCLGEGNFGKVYLGEHNATGNEYAVKFIKKEGKDVDKDFDATAVMEKNIGALSGNTPFLVNLAASFQTKSYLCYVMELVSGGNLFAHICDEEDKGGCGFGEPRTRLYAAEICVGMWYLHEHGIMYRDLKLENVMLCSEGHVKLTDFGLSKEGVRKGGKTTTFVGTPGYLAPEIAIAAVKDDIDLCMYGFEVDWWSLGVLTHEMMFSVAPFEDEEEDAMFKRICEQDPIIVPAEHDVTASPACISFMNQLMTRDPTQRLGYGQMGPQRIEAHPFFKSIDWTKVRNRSYTPDFVPSASIKDNIVDGGPPDIEPARDCEHLEGFEFTAKGFGSNSAC